MDVAGEEKTYHPIRALNSLVRFTGIEKWLISMQCNSGDLVFEFCWVSFFHQFCSSVWILSVRSMGLLSRIHRSKRSSYIDTTVSMLWHNHWFKATW